jgi:hypothetical protein
MARVLRWALAFSVLTAVGCGKDQYAVTGRVKYKDGRDPSALKGGMVTLESTDEAKPMSSRGTIREDGSFTIGTATEDDGAAPGKYVVMVSPPALPRPAQRPPGWPPLKEKYGRADQSGLTFEVEKKSNVLEIIVD